MVDRIAAHKEDFKPKYSGQDCAGCVFLGRYTYQAPFKDKPRKTTVDLYICLGQTDPSLIARFGSAPSKYSSHPIDSSIEEWLSSWRMKNDSEKPTYFDALREVWCRALALGLVKGKKGEKGEWDVDWSDGHSVALDLHVRAKSELDLEALLPMIKAYTEQLSYYIKWHDEGASRTFNCETGTISARVIIGPERLRPPPSKPISLPPPFDPLTFLEAMAADAIQRAERLDLQAATGKKGPVVVAEAREVAARYRLRADAYKTAALEMRLEMEKRGLSQ